MQISRQNSNRIQINAVSPFKRRQMKPRRFENAALLAAVSNRHGFGNSLDRCHVNRRRNRIKTIWLPIKSNQMISFDAWIFRKRKGFLRTPWLKQDRDLVKTAFLSIRASVLGSSPRHSSQSAQPTETEGRRIVSEFFLSKCSLP